MSRSSGKTTGAPAPAGPYSQSVRIGNVVAVAGQSGYEPASGELVSADVSDQTRRALLNIEAALGASGAFLYDVIQVRVYLTDTSYFPVMNEVFRDFFDEPFPARTTVYVGLRNEAKVEIDVLAVTDTTQRKN